MNTNLRRFSQSLGLLFLACGLLACTTQEAKSDASTGTGGTGGRTSTGSGGTTTAGTGGAGGAGYVTNDGVLCPLPMQPLISDFAVVVPDGGAPDGGADPDAAAVATNYVHFGGGTTLGGSEFVYPTSGNYVVNSDVSAGNWHMWGTLGDYSGFGLYFDNCTRVDASAYRGISFTISGSVPQGGIVTMGVGTLNNRIAASWLMTHGNTTATAADPGRCIPNAAAVNQYAQTDCADAIKTIPVTATPTPVTILWTEFAGGKPDINVKPGDINNIYWYFPPPTGAGTTTPTTYAVDLVIDDLSFIAP